MGGALEITQNRITVELQKAVLQSDHTVAVEARVQELQAELQQKAIDYDLLARNLKLRINVIEADAKGNLEESKNLEKQLKEEREKSKQQNHRQDLQIDALERHLREETERHEYSKSKLDNFTGKIKLDLENQIKALHESEKSTRDEKSVLLLELDSARVECECIAKKSREKEKEFLLQLDQDVKAAEGKVKSRLEKSWLEKLKRSEETAAQDVSNYL